MTPPTAVSLQEGNTITVITLNIVNISLQHEEEELEEEEEEEEKKAAR